MFLLELFLNVIKLSMDLLYLNILEILIIFW